MYEVDTPKEPVGAIVGSRGEEQSVVALSRRVFAKRESPQARHGEDGPVRAAQRAVRLSGRRIKHIDLAVAEVAYEQQPAKAAEVRRSKSHAPGCVERAPDDQLPDKTAVGVEDVDDPEPGPGRRYSVGPLWLSVCDVQLRGAAGTVVDRLNAKRCVASWQGGIGEREVGGRRRLFLEGGVENINLVTVKISGVQEIGAAVFGECERGVDRATGVGVRGHCASCADARCPCGNDAALAGVNELRRA